MPVQEAVQKWAMQVSWWFKYGAESDKVTTIARASWGFSFFMQDARVPRRCMLFMLPDWIGINTTLSPRFDTTHPYSANTARQSRVLLNKEAGRTQLAR